jgi:hypothetical protein
MHRRCQSPAVEAVGRWRRRSCHRRPCRVLARDLPETALRTASRRPTTQPSAASLTCAVAWVSKVPHGVVNDPSIDGMQGVRGSNPLSSTRHNVSPLTIAVSSASNLPRKRSESLVLPVLARGVSTDGFSSRSLEKASEFAPRAGRVSPSPSWPTPTTDQVGRAGSVPTVPVAAAGRPRGVEPGDAR